MASGLVTITTVITITITTAITVTVKALTIVLLPTISRNALKKKKLNDLIHIFTLYTSVMKTNVLIAFDKLFQDTDNFFN